MITFSDPNNKYNIIFSIVNDDDECQFIFTNNIVRKSITYNSFIPDYTAEFLKSFLSENFSNQVKFTWHYNGGGMHQINITRYLKNPVFKDRVSFLIIIFGGCNQSAMPSEISSYQSSNDLSHADA